MKVSCPCCKNKVDLPTGKVNRAKKCGYKVYCSRECSSEARRFHRSIEEKKRLKAEYDREFRKKNADIIKKRKHEYFKRTYDPLKASIERKKRMHKHVEYCRRPEYRAYKKQYDVKHRAKKNYGEFADCFLIIQEIEKHYKQEEVRQINNLHNKSQKRKRKWKQNQSKNCQQRI